MEYVSDERAERRSIPGGWTFETVRVGGHSFRLRLPADPDSVLEQFCESPASPEAPEPYWAALWPASRVMAELVLNARWSAGTQVLELGCGIGLVGLAGLARGMQVTFSDHAPPAIELAGENARRNGYSPHRCILLDWRAPIRRTYPKILGSDLIYDPRQHDALLHLLQQMLAADGEFWLGDPGRCHSRAFCDRAGACGFAVSIYDRSGAARRELHVGQFQLLVLRRCEPVLP